MNNDKLRKAYTLLNEAMNEVEYGGSEHKMLLEILERFPLQVR